MKIEKVRRYLAEGVKDLEFIAKQCNCSVSLVRYELARQREKLDRQDMANEPTSQDEVVGKTKEYSTGALTIEVRLKDFPVEIKIRNGSNTLMGTVVLEANGVKYRSPNQKLAANRLLTFTTLKRLMEVGLL